MIKISLQHIDKMLLYIYMIIKRTFMKIYKTIIAIAITGTINVYAEQPSFKTIISSNNVDFTVNYLPAPSKPIVNITTDIDNNGELSIDEIERVSFIHVDINIPNDIQVGYKLRTTGQEDRILNQNDIDNGIVSYQYNIPNYGDILKIESEILNSGSTSSGKNSDLSTVQLYIDKNTLKGDSYYHNYKEFNAHNKKTNFSYETWIKPKKSIKTNSVTNNVDVDGTTFENYSFYPQHGGESGLIHYAGLSVGTNGIKVHAHSSGYMPSLFVDYRTVSSTEWQHVFVVVRNNIPSVYFNGIHIGDGLAPLSGDLYLTNYIGDSGHYGPTEADIANTRVWDNALTDSEVFNVYNKYLNIGYTIGNSTFISSYNN